MTRRLSLQIPAVFVGFGNGHPPSKEGGFRVLFLSTILACMAQYWTPSNFALARHLLPRPPDLAFKFDLLKGPFSKALADDVSDKFL